MSLKVKAKITKQVFAKEEFRIFGCVLSEPNDQIQLNKYGNFTIKGDLSYLSEGKEYTLELEQVQDNYGVSYKVKSVPSFSMESVDSITDDMELELLQEITSPALAETIHSAYPNYLRLILQGKKDEIDLSKIKGVKEYRHNVHVRLINQKFKYYYILEQNKQYSLDISDCKELCNIYSTVEKINEMMAQNPYYCLICICNKSFPKVDKIISECRDDLKLSDIRAEFMALYILQKNEVDGNTYIDAKELCEYCMGIEPKLIARLKDVAIKSDLIYYDEDRNTLAKMDTYLAECSIADFIKGKIRDSVRLDIDYTKYTDIDGFQLTDTQTLALKNFCEYSISMLVGYAGVGKSASMKALVKLLEDNNISYILLAPTGKASAKLSESTGRQASTMHRTVLSGEIYQDVIIVDEFSFFGTEWASMLFNAITNENARIVLVGDNAQLNPISHGKILQDMIDSKIVPMTMLTEVFRYSDGGIMKVATDIRNGKQFLSNEPLQKFGTDYKFIETNNPQDILIDEYMKLINKGVKPSDIMCLSPYNVGDVGCFELNNKLQTIINPPKPKEPFHTYKITRNTKEYEITLRKNDYVINIKNDYKALPYSSWELIEWEDDLTNDDVPLTTVFNGDCGKVVDCDDKKLVVQFGEDLIVYDKSKMHNLLLGMVISSHKSQGSQSPYVIDIIAKEHSRMHTRNLQYVATTRASKQYIEIGDISEMNECLLRQENKERRSMVGELLKEDNND